MRPLLSEATHERLYRTRWPLAASYAAIAAIGLVEGWSLLGVVVISLQALLWPKGVEIAHHRAMAKYRPTWHGFEAPITDRKRPEH